MIIFSNRSASSYLARQLIKNATDLDDSDVDVMLNSNIKYKISSIFKIDKKSVSFDKSKVVE